ncbi:unnamed protein product [Protopolystoma xenopodis]|uniref:Uncharacterized protein n=1 Tax=Protopolystoma xenopodis TaxID=117903 RepID=A0A3S5FD46_9PLAT|nr:unnamed protein product [Protopolystoma xenopodis]
MHPWFSMAGGMSSEDSAYGAMPDDLGSVQTQQLRSQLDPPGSYYYPALAPQSVGSRRRQAPVVSVAGQSAMANVLSGDTPLFSSKEDLADTVSILQAKSLNERSLSPSLQGYPCSTTTGDCYKTYFKSMSHFNSAPLQHPFLDTSFKKTVSSLYNFDKTLLHSLIFLTYDTVLLVKNELDHFTMIQSTLYEVEQERPNLL